MNYPRAVRIARSLADLSQAELADRAEIDRSYLSLIESGKRQASVETIERIASALDMPFHLLALLGSESKDIRKTNVNQIEDLSLALAKLLLEAAPNDEPDAKNETESSSGKRPAKKPPRSGISPRGKARVTAVVG